MKHFQNQIKKRFNHKNKMLKILIFFKFCMIFEKIKINMLNIQNKFGICK